MIDPIPHRTNKAGGPQEGSDHGAAEGRADGASGSGGAAFRVLLERLAQSARELDSASSSIEGPHQLRPVVEDARASVEDAVLLASDLLEAYRATQARSVNASKP